LKKKKVIDLFAGAGGLSCGLEMAGFSPILASDINPSYADTYQKNHPRTEVIVDDIRKICDRNITQILGLETGELDLLAGGPPCQGFSINAPIRSLDDERNHLFKDYLRIAEALKPKAILIENVPGIVSLGKGTVVEQIYKELNRMGYSVKHRILFSGHYGVPQARFRTVFIAIKGKTKNIHFPEPTYNAKATANFTGAKELCLNILPLISQNLNPHTTVWDAISDLPEIEPSNGKSNGIFDYAVEPKSEYQKKLRKNSTSIENHTCTKLGKINLERLKYIPQGGSWRDIPFDLLPAGLKRARRSDHTKRYGRLDPSGLCSTILTKCDPHWGSFFHPIQDRVISVREAARIQSFPDMYIFHGSITQQYEQIGNAVPPFLAKAIGKTILKILENIDE
jgi:DNA (cytosine-5)-methyltransferase 1